MNEKPASLLDKLWTSHEVTQDDAGKSLLWVDRHWVHEGSQHAFAKLADRNLSVAAPTLTFGVTDHYAPTRDRFQLVDESVARMIHTLQHNTKQHGIQCFTMEHTQHGIVHVIGPELGLTLPGLTINCGDSHTSTHGAFGSLAFGIGATEVAHVLATQTIWQTKPNSMRLVFNGELPLGVSAKDLALHWIAALGNDAATGHAIEYGGSAIDNLSMDARMTLCNLSIEGGARFGMIAPDKTTFSYLHGRHHAPSGSLWDSAVKHWQQLRSDADAHFDKTVCFDATTIAPTVTWGTNPEQAIAIDQSIPTLDQFSDAKAEAAQTALDYMGLRSGKPLIGTPIDQVFLGSCTNGRIEDLRAAATILKGRQATVPGLVSPGSMAVKEQAEREGLDAIFISAGLSWEASGCSLCVGMNGDTVAAGKRCASSTNRNFKGRQGRGSRTHIMSPAMVAAAAIHGKIVDVRDERTVGLTVS